MYISISVICTLNTSDFCEFTCSLEKLTISIHNFSLSNKSFKNLSIKSCSKSCRTIVKSPSAILSQFYEVLSNFQSIFRNLFLKKIEDSEQQSALPFVKNPKFATEIFHKSHVLLFFAIIQVIKENNDVSSCERIFVELKKNPFTTHHHQRSLINSPKVSSCIVEI